MMYQDKLAVAIKSNGKVLREFKDNVYLPFGSEYSFLIKNLNTKRAVVKIEIDGRDVTAGGVVVNANSSVDLERFIESLDKGSKFKFIERSAAIEQHRGVQVEDGLVRIEFEFEREASHIFNGIDWSNVVLKGSMGSMGAINNHSTYKGPDCIATTWLSNTSYGSKSGDVSGTFMNCAASASTTSATLSMPKNEVGITVEGSQSDQRFVTTHVNTDGVKHVIVMKLLGESGGNLVQEPVTVKTKAECKYCGKGNKIMSKFCGECGASLQIIK